MVGELRGEIRLLKIATNCVRAARDGVQTVHATIERSVGICRVGGDEPRLAHWAIRADKRRYGVGSAIQRGKRHLWVGNWLLWTSQTRTAAADVWLGMAGCATVGIEGWSQANTGFTGHVARH